MATSLDELGRAPWDGYAVRERVRKTIKKQKRDHLLRLWEEEGVLYDHGAVEYHEYMTRIELEAEGHASPSRLPPDELAESVRWGTR